MFLPRIMQETYSSKIEATLSIDTDNLIGVNDTNEYQQDIETIELKNSQQSLWSGWRHGVAASCLCNITVLILSFAVLIWATTKPTSIDGTRILWQSSYDSIRLSDILLHLGINIVSTMILAGDNYTLQVIIAPTRRNIDRAHHEKRSLDIGISSFHNWRYLGWRRKLLYFCLLALTLPVHLLYNSVVLSTIVDVFLMEGGIVAKDFLQTPPSNASLSNIWHSVQSSNQWIRVSTDDCYGRLTGDGFALQEYSYVLFFTDFTSPPQNSSVYYKLSYPSSYSFLGNGTYLTQGSWLFSMDDTTIFAFLSGELAIVPCTSSDTCQHFNPTNFSRDHNSQRIDMTNIEYCLAQAAYFSSIELVLPLLIIVIICSIFRIAVSILLISSHFYPLITIGDAIASFLDFPDLTTKDMGPTSVMELQRQTSNQRPQDHLPSIQGKAWKTRKLSYFTTATRLRWYLTTSLCFFSCLAGGAFILLVMIDADVWYSLEPPMKLPLVGSILLENTPQLLLSNIYLCYNALFTCMALSVEWMSFCKHRKGLRVSNPEGDQRSTYFLSLPYRYSIPLATKSALLHWIVSQSFNIIRRDSYNSDQTRNPSRDIRQFGIDIDWLMYGAIPVGLFLLVIAIGLGFRKLNAAMPLARSNSLVISAACHPVRADQELGSTERLSTKKLQYGVISSIPSGGYRVGFSDKEVMPLVPGEFYK